MSILLTNGRLFQDNQQVENVDVLLADGKIQAIGQKLAQNGLTADQMIDVKGNLIAPGLVDLHVHFREPGFEYKETIASGSRSAARGGFTTVCAMPNLNPVPDTIERYQKVTEIIQQDAVIHVKQYAPITTDLRSDQIVDMQGLNVAGAMAFTNDGVGVQNAGVMYQAMKQAAEIGVPLVAHTEDESLLFGGCMHQGKVSEKLGLPGILSATEATQIARDLILAEATGVHYHVCHVSTKESVRLIRDAKAAGVKVSCEVCPHHLILTDEAITADNAQFKMNPPLRAAEDRQALIEGLLDGTIDCIATDHAPHSNSEKQQSMTSAPFGIVGSETAFALLYTEFVRTGIFSLQQVLGWLTVKPAELFQLPAGTLTIGAPADIAVFDLDQCYSIEASEFESLSSNTPFIGKEVYGRTLLTFVDGEIVWEEGMTR